MNTDTDMNNWPTADTTPDNTYPTAGGPWEATWPTNNTQNTDMDYPPRDLNPLNDYSPAGPWVDVWPTNV